MIESRAATLRGPDSPTHTVPALASPDFTISLGKRSEFPALYNSSGLLRSLQALDRAQTLPSGTAAGKARSELDANLETVLGMDSTAGHVGGPDAALATLPAGNLSLALSNVLATGNQDASSSDLALQNLLARSMEGLSGTNAASRSRSAADTLNFAGSATATDARKALDALSEKQLDLAAEALDLAGPSAVQSSVVSDSSSALFNRLSAFRIEETLAVSDPQRPRRRRVGPGGTADLLLSGSSLLSGNSLLSGISLLDSIPLPGEAEELDSLAAGIDLSPQLDFETILLRSLAVETDDQQASDAEQDRSVQSEPASNDRPPPDLRNRASQTKPPEPAIPSPPVANRPANAGAAAVPPDNNLREPRYAEIAAAMNMSAAVYRYQAIVSTTVPPGEIDPARTVLAIQGVPPTRKLG